MSKSDGIKEFYAVTHNGVAFIPIASRQAGRLWAKVDAGDAAKMLALKWRLSRLKYAQAWMETPTGRRMILMHHLVAAPGQDHRDRNRLNNTRGNLRPCTRQQNSYNQKSKNDRFKGVCWNRRSRKTWRARIRVDGKRLYLGAFYTEEDAAKAYDAAAIKWHKEFAVLNFPNKSA